MELHRQRGGAQIYRELKSLSPLPPVLTYASSVMFNCRLSNPEPEPEDIEVLNTCTGTVDEAWFYAISAAIESLSGPLLLKAINECHVDAELIERMGDLLLRMPERCNPRVFHEQVRPLLSGWEPPNPLKIDGEAVYWHGASAAQSPLFQAIDHLLNIQHPPEAKAYAQEMRNRYMLPQHAAYLNWLETNITPIPNERAITALARFRRIHWAIVEMYIRKQDPDAKGTGGTDPRIFLTAMQQ